MQKNLMKELVAALVFLLVACANPAMLPAITDDARLSAVPQPISESSPPSQGALMAALVPDQKLLEAIDNAIVYPCGEQVRFENDPLIRYLFDHIEEAHPLLIEALRDGEVRDYARVFRILALAGRPESVPVMEEFLVSTESLDSTKSSAGQYVGLHPSPEALAVLLRALNTTNTKTFFGATLGLMERKDKAACEPLRKELTRKDDSQRYYAIQAAGDLGCLTKKELTEISRQDKSPDIRNKAKELIKTNKGTP